MEGFHKKPNVYVGEVTIKVSNLEVSLNFYQQIIGLQLLEKTRHMAVLTADGKTSLLTIVQPPNVTEKERGTTGLYHFAILLPSRADLAVFLRHLLVAKYPLGAADHYVSEALYLNDPDGNGIEVYRDRPSSEWTWNNGLVDMATVELDAEGILSESQTEWSGLPSETLMGHIHLHVNNLKEAEDFYAKGIGFNIVSYYPEAVFLSTGHYHHHVAINTWQGVGAALPQKNSVGLNWYTLVFPDGATRDETIDRLQKMGAEIIKEKDYFITKDPAGNQIHLVI